MRKAQFFLILLLAAVAASNVMAEVPDAFTLAWTDFEFKNKDLLNVQSPDTLSQAKNDNTELDEQYLFAQTQAGEQTDSTTVTEEPSAFSSADEAARKSANPLGGDFFILLNQIDNYAMEGDITDKTRWIN